ncbi:hypothetical protein OBBRIDRAFT_805608 [Obba rivulosa]|uniref:Cytochrome P450 n=1 Tax=Obba rivulosa TaxID=1052685 RepID=A0A8E2ATW0_9APHY|nr:hypothetical protein OBBRIDRAFT_805608 [Obba rivulosa]
MTTHLDSLLLVFLTGPGLVLVLLWRFKEIFHPHHLPYPPGPKGWPIIGNVLDVVPISYPNSKYREVRIRITRATVCEVLRSNAFRLTIIRRHRRAIHQYFNIGVIRQYRQAQFQKARQLLLRLFSDPTHVLPLVRLTTGETIIQLAYGDAAADSDDKYLIPARTAEGKQSKVLVPGKYLIYISAWFPGAVFKRELTGCKATQIAMVDTAFDDIRRTGMLDKLSQSNDGRVRADYTKVIKNSTNITLQDFFAAMVRHPEVQRKA